MINWVTASRFGLTDATRRFLAHQRSLHAGYLPSSKAKTWFGVFLELRPAGGLTAESDLICPCDFNSSQRPSFSFDSGASK